MRHIARSARGAVNRYQAIAPYVRSTDRVLDVGAGGGEVVYTLRRLGFDASGIEPDEQYARHAREVLGVPVRTGFVQDVSCPERSLDVITMYHALEHVDDPSAILLHLRRWLVDQGQLFVEVPNVEARCIAPSHRFHFAHFYNFNSHTLKALGQKAGFTTVHMSSSSDGGNLIGVFKAAHGAGPVQTDPGNYARVASTIREHTTLKYFCSPYPYVAPLGRLRAYVTDRWIAAGCTSARQVLDKVIDAQLKLRPTDRPNARSRAQRHPR